MPGRDRENVNTAIPITVPEKAGAKKEDLRTRERPRLTRISAVPGTRAGKM